MQHNSRLFVLMLATVLAMLASAVGPYSVYADDGDVPGAPGGDPLASETAPTPDAPGETPSGEEQPVVEGPVLVSEIIEQIPEGTDLVVLNEGGEIEPLATEAAAEIIATSDPMWCPSGATPGDAGCTGSFPTFEQLIDALTTDAISGSPVYTGNGVIWVEDSYSGNDANQIIFDGTQLTNLNNNNLTIQGGWSGGNNTTVTGTSLLDVSLVFANWTGSLTLNDLDIAAADDAGFGLLIQNTGNISLNNVSVNDTPENAYGMGDGAVLNNTGDVAIADSDFNNNQGNGLQVDSGGTITVDTVTASNNALTGAYLDSCRYNNVSGLCAGNGSVTITSATSNLFENNGFNGIVVDAGGGVAMDHVYANNNGLDGANLTSADSNGTGNVNVTQSEFTGNSNGYGLDVLTDGNLTLTNVIARNNSVGAVLDTTAGIGAVNVTNSSFGDTSVNGNYWTGLHVDSGSTVTLTNVIASFNGTNGAYLTAADDIAVNNSQFNGNVHFNFPQDPGLYAKSNGGNITLTDVVADGNVYGAGAVLLTNGSGEVLVTGTVPNASHFNGNGTFGIQAGSNNGDITLDNIVASNNASKGAYLISNGSGNIFIYDSGFVENGAYGIYAAANTGNLELDGVVENGDDGVDPATNLTDIGAYLKSYSGSVFVSNSAFDYNTSTGLLIVSGSTVDLFNVTADHNGDNGVEIYSSYTASCKRPGDNVVNVAVNVDGGAFTNNGGYGLMVQPGPAGTVVFVTPSLFGGNGLEDYLLDLSDPSDCVETPADPGGTGNPGIPNIVPVPATGGVPVEQDCEQFSSTILQLPNGTWINVGCPFEGFSNLEEIQQNGLPGALGAGTDFVAGVTVSLTDNEGKVILNEDGTVTINFSIPQNSRARSYSVLFWDPTLNNGEGGWVKLPIFEFGTSFPLHPDDPDDARLIISGVKKNGGTISFTVNFPGVFVLVSP